MTTISRRPINGQIEADDIKSPNHYTWRGKECEEFGVNELITGIFWMIYFIIIIILNVAGQ